MRKSTFASLLILCGSTAALAHAALPAGQVVQNNTLDNTLGNEVTPPAEPMPNETMTPAPVPTPTDSDPLGNEATEPK